ncbi:Hypothetical protein D9617_51g088970 [Elsinoe fawcettii]|nr:Hypothetical protein D9617_51g088970 [Elsinoe fawcettii]
MAHLAYEQYEKEKATVIAKGFLSYAAMSLSWLQLSDQDDWKVDDDKLAALKHDFGKEKLCSKWIPQNHVLATISKADWLRLPAACTFTDICECPQDIQPIVEDATHGTSKYRVNVIQGKHRIRACQEVMEEGMQWWIFSLYDEALDSSVVEYMTRKITRQPAAAPADVLRDLYSAEVNVDANQRKLITEPLLRSQRNRYGQLLKEDCAFGSAFRGIAQDARLEALLQCAPLGALNHVLPSRFHEQLNTYLEKVHDIWSAISLVAGRIDKHAVERLGGLTPKYSLAHQEIIKQWVEGLGAPDDDGNRLLEFLFRHEKIVTVGTFLADVKVLSMCQKLMLGRLRRGGSRKQSLESAYRELTSVEAGFYSRWCELLLSCIRHVRLCEVARAGFSVTEDDLDEFVSRARVLDFKFEEREESVLGRRGAYLKANDRIRLTQPEAWGCERAGAPVRHARQRRIVRKDNRSINRTVERPRLSMGEALSATTSDDWSGALLLTRMYHSENLNPIEAHISPLGFVIATMSCFLNRSNIMQERVEQADMYRVFSGLTPPPSEIDRRSSAVWAHLRRSGTFHSLEERIRRMCQDTDDSGAVSTIIIEEDSSSTIPLRERPAPVESQSRVPLEDEIPTHLPLCPCRDAAATGFHMCRCKEDNSTVVDEYAAMKKAATDHALRQTRAEAEIEELQIEKSELVEQLAELNDKITSATKDRDALNQAIDTRKAQLMSLMHDKSPMRGASTRFAPSESHKRKFVPSESSDARPRKIRAQG